MGFQDALRGYAYEVHRRDGFKCVYCGLDGTVWPNWLPRAENGDRLVELAVGEGHVRDLAVTHNPGKRVILNPRNTAGKLTHREVQLHRQGGSPGPAAIRVDNLASESPAEAALDERRWTSMHRLQRRGDGP